MKPIIMSTEDVRAILDGRKTMTRQVIKPRPTHWDDGERVYDKDSIVGPEFYAPVRVDKNGEQYPGKEVYGIYSDDGEYGCKAPYQPGDVLWVREKWRTVDYEYCDGKWSAAVERVDGTKDMRVSWYDNSDVGIPYEGPYSTIGWKPSIHMPREAARLFLRVTDVRAERVQEIAFLDALDEGIKADFVPPDGWVEDDAIAIAGAMRSRNGATAAFRALWDTRNAKRGYGWDSNPWVWAIKFEKCGSE